MKKFMSNSVIQALNELGGYFTFSDDEGYEYIVIRRDDFDALRDSIDEVQLALPEAEETPSAEDMLEKINRDIAIFKQTQEEQEEIDDLDIMDEDIMETADDEVIESPTEPTIEHIEPAMEQQAVQATDEMEPPRRVRFEPIHGDLPPELQE